MNKLSVVLATKNEERNIGRCLEAIVDIADEIIVYDEYSDDNTVLIAKKYKAKVFLEPHHDNFHITKQKAIDKAQGDWILQLDADEVITPKLREEIKQIISLSQDEIKSRRNEDHRMARLFSKHQKIIEERDGISFDTEDDIVAFLIPRRNIFIGKPIVYAGVYPDPAIRLFRRGMAYLPAKSVHEIMSVSGSVSWLFNDMDHYDSTTLERYIMRLNRYTDLRADEYLSSKVKKDSIHLFAYSFILPSILFLKLFFRYKGFKDGMRGFIWSAFSASHIPIGYYKYWTKVAS